MLKSCTSTQMLTNTTMEKLHQHKILFPTLFLLLLLLQFCSLRLVSSEYELPQNYFINCGSKSDVPINNRNFVGDDKSSDSSFFVGQSEPVNDTNPSTGTSILYQSARIYKRSSSYKLEIDQTGIYLVRLHFFTFLSPINLTKALFNVSTSKFSLLSNFSVQNSSTLPVIKEFLLPINEREFKINFIPLQESSLAFVNAIEVFLVPPSFIPSSATHVTSSGSKGNYNGLPSHLLHTVHRINVGGQKISPYSDTLLRTWITDNDLVNPNDAKGSQGSSEQVRYDTEGASTKYIAPANVYATARNTSTDSISWHLKVSKNACHLVRVHFCDFINWQTHVLFNLSIDSKFNQTINEYNITKQPALPFYMDFVADSDDSGFMNISLGPPSNSPGLVAFLNGLEIMELMNSSEPKKNDMIAKAGLISAGAFVIILIVVVFLSLKCRKTKPRETKRWPLSVPHSYNRFPERTANCFPASNLNLELRISLAEILHATKRFDNSLLIGDGGFGKVYRGTLRGKEVAVKRSLPGTEQGLDEFRTEIMVLSQIRHRHLLSLVGYCDEEPEMILVFEYMEKGNLRDNLYDWDENSERSFSRSELTWTKRLEICIGSAKGLHYLHTGAAGGIIHRDVKSTNILLDEHYEAKVADFGISKSGLTDSACTYTDVKGSRGYLAPEYVRTHKYTYKSDVYSFGVVLLEVLCARPAIKPWAPREELNLAYWGKKWHKKGQLEKIIDPVLVGKIDPNSLRIFGEIVEKCLKENGSERPDMDVVVWNLQYALSRHRQAGIDREAHDDSTTNGLFPSIQHLPSNNFPIEEIDMSIGGDGDSDTTASQVFSQIRSEGGR